MENRKRNVRLRFDLTDKEKELFERKKEESKAKNMRINIFNGFFSPKFHNFFRIRI